MRNPVVHRCVRLIAESAARVPKVVHENGQRLSEHPLLTLLQQANPIPTAFDLWELTTLYQEVHGSAYWGLDLDPVLVHQRFEARKP